MPVKTVSAKSATASTRKPRNKFERALGVAEPNVGKPRVKRVKVQRADPFVEATDFEPTVVETGDQAEARQLKTMQDESAATIAADAVKDLPKDCICGDYHKGECASEVVGSQAWAAAQAKDILGPAATAWSATHDAKGVAYKVEQFRVGVPTAETKAWEKIGEQWFAIEGGKSIRGTGASYLAAVAHARKRKA